MGDFRGVAVRLIVIGAACFVVGAGVWFESVNANAHEHAVVYYLRACESDASCHMTDGQPVSVALAQAEENVRVNDALTTFGIVAMIAGGLVLAGGTLAVVVPGRRHSEGDDDSRLECSSCHRDAPAGAAYCPACGRALAPPGACGSCGYPLEHGAAYCVGCGSRVVTQLVRA